MYQRIKLSDDVRVTLYYMALCQNCESLLPQPFTAWQERNAWTQAHVEGTGHDVTQHTEIIIKSP